MDKGSKRIRRRSEDDDKSNDVIMNEHQGDQTSFKDILTHTAKPLPWTGAVDDDIMLENRDVITGVENGVLSISFSERVHIVVKQSMAKTMIVKLLGKRIGLNALWNKICSLQKLPQSFQLVDLENDYSLAKFQAFWGLYKGFI
ncbi:hypothetical protein J1N35_030377 [Gossypium stocksii]|uniref:Uncharacterized protein n=1 Tax=Gossypium stocksii TaxID=47602 RepID=A0A9D3UZZ9_9ROSI|nr:hypothetical protein J1N35_030377 [Gossypium stocksii]